ncbi:peptide chain release factor N(5)-glutamine methyltransferase [Terriglobus sp.]|uniref:peptide chain release factor N(5)-glutamine methyltransferase n=1 Tax=Terriglobus sp. TaxID=1889013 RepID=UPI003AFF6F6D
MTPPSDLRTALQQTATMLAMRSDLRDRARQDAPQLVELATGLCRAQQLASPHRLLGHEEVQALHTLVQRRLQAEPIQHLRGSQEFYGRDFIVSPDVLIPRPETEDIVAAVLEATPDRNTPLRIADVGTGSGILAVTLALELPLSLVTGFEISPAALAIAQRNAHALGAADRVHLVESDLLAAASDGECFDVIVSNPPYIPLTDAPTLHAEVRDHEPHLALFAGEDGHDIYRRLIPEAHSHLRPGGLLLLETGGRVDLIHRMLAEGFHDAVTRQDLQGIARIVSARRN